MSAHIIDDSLDQQRSSKLQEEIAEETADSNCAQYNRSQGRRQNRAGVNDNDILDGIPVRQWRYEEVVVVPPPAQETNTSPDDIWAVELPHGMPKDSHLLPPFLQEILKGARSGKFFAQKKAPSEEEEVDAEPIPGEKPEKKDEDMTEKGFVAKAWKQVPRHMEGPDIEYLAKRRPGLVTASSKPIDVGPTITKATVKRVDAAGNAYTQNVVIQPGQAVDGEIISQTVVPAPAAASVSEGSHFPTPPRRQIKRKMKGPGRGKKKIKLNPAEPSTVPQTIDVDGVTQPATESGVVGPNGVKLETETSVVSVGNEDTEMADGSVHDSSDDDGEEGEEGDFDHEASADPKSPSKPPAESSTPANFQPTLAAIPSLPPTEAIVTETILQIQKPELKIGSPLKNVALSTSTANSPLEPTNANIPLSNETPPQVVASLSEIAEPAHAPIIEDSVMQEVTDTAPSALPSPPPAPTTEDVIASTELVRAEEEEEKLLLEIIDKVPDISPSTAQPNPPAATEAIVELRETEVEPAQTVVESVDPVPDPAAVEIELEEAVVKPEAIEVEPIKAVSEPIEAMPAPVDAAAELVEAAPELVEAAPEFVEAAPELVEAAPELVEAAPELVEAAPELVEAVSETVAAVPDPVETVVLPIEVIAEPILASVSPDESSLPQEPAVETVAVSVTGDAQSPEKITTQIVTETKDDAVALSPIPPTLAVVAETKDDKEDRFSDLLGGLEKQLNEPIPAEEEKATES